MQEAITDIFVDPGSIVRLLERTEVTIPDLIANLQGHGSDVSAIVLDALHKNYPKNLCEMLKVKDIEFLLNVNREQKFSVVEWLIDAVNLHFEELGMDMQRKLIVLFEEFLMQSSGNDGEIIDNSIALLDRLTNAVDSSFDVDPLFLMWLSGRLCEKIVGPAYMNVFYKTLAVSDETTVTDAAIEHDVIISKLLELVGFDGLKEHVSLTFISKGLLQIYKKSNFTTELSSEKCLEYIIDIYGQRNLGQAGIQTIVEELSSMNVLDALFKLSKRIESKKAQIHSLVVILLQSMKVQDALVGLDASYFLESKQLKSATEEFLLNAVNVSLGPELEFTLVALLKQFSEGNEGFKKTLIAKTNKPIFVVAVLPILPDDLSQKLSSFKGVDDMLLDIVKSLETSADAQLCISFLVVAKNFLKFPTIVIRELATKESLSKLEKSAKFQTNNFNFVLYVLEQNPDSVDFIEDADWLVQEIQKETTIKLEHLGLLTKLMESNYSIVSKIDKNYISAVLDLKVPASKEGDIAKFVALFQKSPANVFSGSEILDWMIKKHKISGALTFLGNDKVLAILKDQLFQISELPTSKQTLTLIAKKLDELFLVISKLDSEEADLKLSELATTQVLEKMHDSMVNLNHVNKSAANRFYSLLVHAQFPVTMLDVIVSMNLDSTVSIFKVNWDEVLLITELMGLIDSEKSSSLPLLMEFYFEGINGRPLNPSSGVAILDFLQYNHLEELLKNDLPASRAARLYDQIKSNSAPKFSDYLQLLLQNNLISVIINEQNAESIVQECVFLLQNDDSTLQYNSMRSLVQVFLQKQELIVNSLKNIILSGLNFSTIKSIIDGARQSNPNVRLDFPTVKYLTSLFDFTTDSDLQTEILDYIIEENLLALTYTDAYHIPYLPRLVTKYSGVQFDELLYFSLNIYMRQNLADATRRFFSKNFTEQVVELLKHKTRHVATLDELRLLSYIAVGFAYQQEIDPSSFRNIHQFAIFLATKAYWTQKVAEESNYKMLGATRFRENKAGYLETVAIVLYQIENKRKLFQEILQKWEIVELPENMNNDEATKKKSVESFVSLFDIDESTYLRIVGKVANIGNKE